MKKIIALFHPLFFGLSSILYLYIHNIDQVSASELILPLIGFTVLTLVLWSLAAIITKSAWRASAATSVFVILFMSYGHVNNLINGLAIQNFIIGRNRFLLPFSILLLSAGLFIVLRIKPAGRLFNFNKVLGIIVIFFLFITIIPVGIPKLQKAASPLYNRPEVSKSVSVLQTPKRDTNVVGKFPHIYYIILDSYSSNSVLKEVFNFDNKEFTRYLENKGFFIASESLCNYAFSMVAMASSLNMTYINSLSQNTGEESNDTSVLRQLIQDNEVERFLKSMGYTIVRIGLGSALEYVKNKQVIRMGIISNQFLIMVLIQSTALRPFAPYLGSSILRKQVLSAFDELAKTVEIEKPVFVYAHILCPHPPFIFNAEGKSLGITDIMLGAAYPYAPYVEQVKFINRKVEDLVDTLIEKSKTPPIIVIQSDHGVGYIFDPVIFSKAQPNKRFLKAQMNIFNAIYLPDKDNALLYKTITPVNTFRVIFSQYFGAQCSLLEDRSYYSSHVMPYKFSDVTDAATYKK